MNALPNEIIIYIMNFMTNKSLEQFSKTSSLNFRLSQIVWKKRYKQIANKFKIVNVEEPDETKVGYWYNMYVNVLLTDIISLARKTMENHSSSHPKQKYENAVALFEIILGCRDILFDRRGMKKFRTMVKKKLESFMNSKGSSTASINQIHIAHIYFPLFFPYEYILILFDNQKLFSYHIRSVWKIYGLSPSFSISLFLP
jgi:hypothetical protein